MSTRWELKEIVVRPEQFRLPDGQPIVLERFTPSAGTIQQWMDVSKARGWIEEAYRLAHDDAKIASMDLDRHTSTGSLPVDRRGYALPMASSQADYLQKITSAIANAYNMVNVLWFNDPVARALYRKWLAGPPQIVSGSNLSAQFRSTVNYGNVWPNANPVNEWFVPNKEYPLGTTFGGIIPRAARAKFEALYGRGDAGRTHPSAFVLGPGLYIDYSRAEQAGAEERCPSSETPIISGKAEWSSAVQNYGTPSVASFTSHIPLGHRAMCLANQGAGPRCFGVDGRGIPNYVNLNWNDLWFDTGLEVGGRDVAPSDPIGLWAPAREYLPYLREWTEALMARSPEQIASDSRTYVVYQNGMRFQLNPDVTASQNVNDALLRDARVATARTALDPIATAFATTIAAVGAALSTVTYGWSAVIGGAISAAIVVTNTLLCKPVGERSGIVAKDDIGRWKPTFDRGWLVGSLAPNMVTPLPDALEVPDPPRWERSVTAPVMQLTPPGGFQLRYSGDHGYFQSQPGRIKVPAGKPFRVRWVVGNNGSNAWRSAVAPAGQVPLVVEPSSLRLAEIAAQPAPARPPPPRATVEPTPSRLAEFAPVVLRHVGGSNFGFSVIHMPPNSVIEPGQTVEFSADLIAPRQLGVHRSSWQLSRLDAASGFGVVSTVEIEVVPAMGKTGVVLTVVGLAALGILAAKRFVKGA